MPRKRIEDELRDVPLNLKVTKTHRAKLAALAKARNVGSDTQAIIQLIEEDFTAKRLKLPKP